MDKLVLVFSIFRSQSITLELDDREFFAVEGDRVPVWKGFKRFVPQKGGEGTGKILRSF